MRGFRIAAVAALLMICNAADARKPAPPMPDLPVHPERTVQLGSAVLKSCQNGRAFCGKLSRPLDPSGGVAGSIDIAYEFYPRKDSTQPALSTIVATEGGPGYSTTASRAGYLDLFKPLMDRRALLLVDNRGTGLSAPIDCEDVQLIYPLTPEAIAACGTQLGDTSDLYGSALAADDLAAVIDSMALGAVDLYGDSYGTYFSQVFAARHPDLLRTLTLDGAYQVTHLSPWYPENAKTVRIAFDAVCKRAAACKALPGGSIDRIGAMVAGLRASPVSGTAPDGNGTPLSVTADPASVAFAMYTAGFTRAIFRELDAAARAFLDNGDAAPLLRIVAESQGDYYPAAVDAQVRLLSSGLYLAVSCSDYPQIYDMTATPDKRRKQRDSAIAKKQANNPNLYSPFTYQEYEAMPLDYSLLDMCLDWPMPSPAYPPSRPVPDDAPFTTAPVLVLSGELDTVTSPPGGTTTAGQFANAQQVIVANSFHVTAIGDVDHCASTLVRQFVLNLSPGDTACARTIPEVRTVPAFALATSQLAPATAVSGNKAGDAALRAAAAAVLGAGDVLGRWWVNYDASGVGLRGGSFSYASTSSGYRFTLDQLQFTADQRIGGTIDWNTGTGAIVATLTLSGDSGVPAGTLKASWNDLAVGPVATISGTLDAKKLKASMAAP